jgi:hypothetical protein
MTTGLTVTVEGQPVPLEECGWFESLPCGCIVAMVLAVVGDRVLATAAQAHQHLNPKKRDRDEAAREGITTGLMTMTHYRTNVGAKWECAQHATEGAQR